MLITSSSEESSALLSLACPQQATAPEPSGLVTLGGCLFHLQKFYMLHVMLLGSEDP